MELADVRVTTANARFDVRWRQGVMGKVALAQDARVNICGRALEQAGGAGQEQLVLHDGWGGTLGDPGLDVISLDPLGEPAHAAVAVEGVRSERPEK